MPPISVTFTFETATEAAAFLEGRVGQVAGTSAAPTASKPGARTRVAPAAAPAAAAVPAHAPKVAAPAVADTEALKKTAIGKLVTLINANDALGRNGKQICTDLCLKFGGSNISKISPDKYPEVIAAVGEALEALNSDPTA